MSNLAVHEKVTSGASVASAVSPGRDPNRLRPGAVPCVRRRLEEWMGSTDGLSRRGWDGSLSLGQGFNHIVVYGQVKRARRRGAARREGVEYDHFGIYSLLHTSFVSSPLRDHVARILRCRLFQLDIPRKPSVTCTTRTDIPQNTRFDKIWCALDKIAAI